MKVPKITVQLVHIDGPFKGRIDEFSGEVITIGRDPKCHLAFPVDLNIISRKHAEIRREGNRFKIIDFSTNGTFIRGEAIEEAYLKNGDVIVFSEEGPKVSFLTQIKEVEEGDTEKTLDRIPSGEVAREAPSVAPPPRVEAQPVVSFTVQYGPSIHTFKQASLKIGTDPRCDFVLQEPGIAAFHVEVFHQQGHYWVKDLSGEARALLNGRPLIAPTALRQGDLLYLFKDGTIFEYLGEGKLSQKVVQQRHVAPEPRVPRTPPVTPLQQQMPPVPPSAPPRQVPLPSDTPAPRMERRRKERKPPPLHTPKPRKTHPSFSVPMWVWVALGSALIVAVLVYFIAQWGSQ